MISVGAQHWIQRARVAQEKWGRVPAEARARALRQLRRLIASRQDTIVDSIVSDTGKPPLDALSGDVLVTIEQMLFYERNAARILASRPVGRTLLFYQGARFTEHFEPHGVALVYGPANYPFQLSMVPATTALYAGNAVMLKMSEHAPATARIVEDLVRDSGLPEGLLQVAHDGGDEAGAFIDAEPDIVFFTGSSANGRSVASRAAARLIPTVLELGGKDAALVFADCNFERALEGVTYGAFSNAGQVCVGIKRLYVQESLYERFLGGLLARVEQLRVGSHFESDLGVIERKAARSALTAQVEDAIQRGATLLTVPPRGEYGDRPIVLRDVPADAKLMTEESFGPVLWVQRFSGEEDAVRLANASPFALGASVWTTNRSRGQRVASALHAGTCAINDVIRNIANPHASFGGNGVSGYGRYRGAQGLLTFSRSKTIMSLRSSRKREINWFPFTRKTYDQLRTIIELRHRPQGLFRAISRVLRLGAMLLGTYNSSLLHGSGFGHLWLDVEVPKGDRGEVGYLVFRSPEGFPQERKQAFIHGFASQAGAQGTVRIDAGEIPPGRYAVSVYLDENGNRKLDFGLLGIPKEPVGASNNPKVRLGSPHFEDCAFQMESSDRTISIRLVKAR